MNDVPIEKISEKDRLRFIFISIIITIIILIAALAWNSWIHHVVFEAFGNKNLSTRTIYVLLVTAILIIIVVSLANKLPPSTQISIF